jgi:hypothetical protein
MGRETMASVEIGNEEWRTPLDFYQINRQIWRVIESAVSF